MGSVTVHIDGPAFCTVKIDQIVVFNLNKKMEEYLHFVFRVTFQRNMVLLFGLSLMLITRQWRT